MEPLSALSVAAAAVQFLDFAGKIVSTAKEIHEYGEIARHAHSFDVTHDLADLVARLQIQPSTFTSAQMSANEQKLDELAKKCHKLAIDLMKDLRRLKNGPNSSRSSEFVKAVKTVWKRPKIETLQSSVQEYRQELVLHILVECRDKTSRIENALSKLDSGSREVVEALMRGEDAMARKHQNLLSELQNSLLDHHQKNVDEHRETRAEIRQVMLDITQSRRPSIPTDSPLLRIDDDMIADSVLRSLSFRYMNDREESIQLAHQKTFEWIFNPSGSRQGHKPLWSNMSTFLTAGGSNNCYWIVGKAGSGKSTLMKFLSRHPKLHDSLRLWAGDANLFVANFFFWNLGTKEQKSHEGLLQAILHQMLSRCRSLISSVLPDMWFEAQRLIEAQMSIIAEGKLPIAGPRAPSMQELKCGLAKLMHDTSGSKFCLLIDGIDEYDGNHREISQVLKSLCSNNLKIIVSSRPILACDDVFSGSHSLRLQDLTKPDMRQYVNDKLINNKDFKRAVRSERSDGHKFEQAILDKASGVFLWVYLAVRSLLNGLENGDRRETLWQRLDSLPPELEQLYHSMLGKMDPLYKSEASKIFQLVSLHQAVDTTGPLFTLVLALADDLQTTQRLLDTGKPLPRSFVLDSVKNEQKRLVTRCCGLLETVGNSNDSRIEYLHRTVAEYLQERQIWNQIKEWYQQTNPVTPEDLAVAHMFILKFKVIWRPPVPGSTKMVGNRRSLVQVGESHHTRLASLVQESMSQSMAYIMSCEELPMRISLMDRLVGVMPNLEAGDRFPVQWLGYFHEMQAARTTKKGTKPDRNIESPAIRKADMKCSWILVTLIENNLPDDLLFWLQRDRTILDTFGTNLLHLALAVVVGDEKYGPVKRWNDPEISKNGSTANMCFGVLLKFGCSPNDSGIPSDAAGHETEVPSPWRMFLRSIFLAGQEGDGKVRRGSRNLAEALVLLLRHGAKVDETIEVEAATYTVLDVVTFTVLDVVHEAFKQVKEWPPSLQNLSHSGLRVYDEYIKQGGDPGRISGKWANERGTVREQRGLPGIEFKWPLDEGGGDRRGTWLSENGEW